MKRPSPRLRTALALLAAGLTAALLMAPSAAGAATGATGAAGAEGVSVSVDRDRIDTVVGDRFTIRTRLSGAATTTRPMIAHLNVASLTPDVYVDPEDWSTTRTQQVDAVPSTDGTTLTWQLQAVNAGSFNAYVVLLPTEAGSGSPAGGALTASPPVRVTVAGRRTLSAGGVLPVVLLVPALLGLLVLVRVRGRRRPRDPAPSGSGS